MTDTIQTLDAQDAISIIWRINSNMFRPDSNHKSTVRGSRKIDYSRRDPSGEIRNALHGPLRSLVGNWGKAVDKKRFSLDTQRALLLFAQQKEDYRIILSGTKTLLDEVIIVAQYDQEELDKEPYGEAEGLYRQIKSVTTCLSAVQARPYDERLRIQMRQAEARDKEADGSLNKALDALSDEPQIFLIKEGTVIPNRKAEMLEGTGYRSQGISSAEMFYLGELAAQSTEDTTKIPLCLHRTIGEYIGVAGAILTSFKQGFELNPQLCNDTTRALAERALQTMRLNVVGALDFTDLEGLRSRTTEIIELLGLDDPKTFETLKAQVKEMPTRTSASEKRGGCPFGHC
jgi:hypothetical protein